MSPASSRCSDLTSPRQSLNRRPLRNISLSQFLIFFRLGPCVSLCPCVSRNPNARRRLHPVSARVGLGPRQLALQREAESTGRERQLALTQAAVQRAGQLSSALQQQAIARAQLMDRTVAQVPGRALGQNRSTRRL